MTCPCSLPSNSSSWVSKTTLDSLKYLKTILPLYMAIYIFVIHEHYRVLHLSTQLQEEFVLEDPSGSKWETIGEWRLIQGRILDGVTR